MIEYGVLKIHPFVCTLICLGIHQNYVIYNPLSFSDFPMHNLISELHHEVS